MERRGRDTIEVVWLLHYLDGRTCVEEAFVPLTPVGADGDGPIGDVRTKNVGPESKAHQLLLEDFFVQKSRGQQKKKKKVLKPWEKTLMWKIELYWCIILYKQQRKGGEGAASFLNLSDDVSGPNRHGGQGGSSRIEDEHEPLDLGVQENEDNGDGVALPSNGPRGNIVMNLRSLELRGKSPWFE